MSILFRSHYGRSHHRGKSHTHTPISGEDWSDISHYILGNDSRDIVWKKSTTTDIRAKNRHDQQQVQLVFCIDIHHRYGDDFMYADAPISRSMWKKQSEKILIQAAQQWGYQYHLLHESLPALAGYLQKHRIQEHLIIILSNYPDTSLITTLTPYSRINDILWVQAYHPWEHDPDGSILINGGVCWSQKNHIKYKKAREQWEWEVQVQCRNSHITPLFPSIENPIDQVMNYFFKHRYG